MADEGNNSTFSASDDAEYGFKRPEMYSDKLAGTADPCARHLFLCYKSPEAWGPRVEDEGLPKLLASALKARKEDIVKTKFTVCYGGDSEGDVLIFPEMNRYKGLKESDVDNFVEDVLINGKLWDSGVQESFSGSYVFVCAHTSRDKRCGVCGPPIMEKFNKEIELRGLTDQIFVRACSHVGQHKYAGNVIIYSSDSEAKTTGHWYGYVTPDDVPALLDQHIAKGEIVERIWRGQLGAYTEAAELKLPNGKDEKKHEQEQPIVSDKQEMNGVAGGCCQGVNGFSCCRDDNAETSKKRSCGKLSSWIQSLDQSDYLAAAGVVTAAATVAVAYSFYKRSG